MGKTSIEWTDFSINPIRARLKSDPEKVGHYCELVSAGCANCYASRSQARFGLPKFPGRRSLPVKGEGVSPSADLEVFFDESKLEEVLRRRKPTRWFWCDMTDLFGEWVPDEWRDRCLATMYETPWHIHQVLTKRVGGAASYFIHPRRRELIEQSAFELAMRRDPKKPRVLRHEEIVAGIEWPLKNVWLGVSVENQAQMIQRHTLLADIPAAVRWWSVEPMLGPITPAVEWKRFGKPDWVVCGGESGPGARPMELAWAKSLRDTCGRAKVPFFFKQWGAWVPYATGIGSNIYIGPREEATRTLLDRVEYFRVGKKKAGRMLDGREWSEFPRVEEVSV